MEQFIAVLVLYKLNLNKSKTFLSILKSLQKAGSKLDLLVYDNSPAYNADIASTISSLSEVNINYYPDNNNSGVSKAYNLAQSVGKVNGKKWIILFDQDTDFPEDMIEKYIDATRTFPNDKLFAPIMFANQKTMISPCYFKLMRGFSASGVTTGISSLKKYSVINCGLCIDIDSFMVNNGYNELIRLDFSDHDFIRRFKDTVTDRFIVIDLKVNHELSTESKNSAKSDLVRFDYYLEGAKYISSSVFESFLLKIHAALRSLKLTLIHKDFSFIKKLL
ncbi:glycosyltransferase [Mucilaginibacter sp. SP1R1]|uniref:glycosyltransferase n=1 Tax=Mucilaginibacter sp. SP1R1 TaxID=2723091 RepID=UPI0016166CD2|nr:glycosyltransferase [Mucilaginibacter sp. SP1R1]MBB6149563.1 hypothetical protein [Mucilaginibacter sp. SP1R1]